MRTVVQRVKDASVKVPAEGYESSIGHGLLLLVGFTDDDTEEDLLWTARKIAAMRIFDDQDGVMNLSVKDVGGDILAVSQFTLYGNCRKGRRPSFAEAAPPELGNRLYEQFMRDCTDLGYPPQHGRFGADMTRVISLNETSLLLWNELQGKEFEVEDVINTLTTNYEVEREVAAADAAKWIEKLNECDLVE